MARADSTMAELRAGKTLTTNERHTFVVERDPAQIFELRAAFEHDSPIPMPRRSPDIVISEREPPPVLLMPTLRAVFAYAEENGGKKLLVVGHTDTSGTPGYNQTLSEKRAEAMHALLTGDAGAFARICHQHETARDLQLLLSWAAREHGLGCDPGPIDEQLGPMTRAARDRFRRRYNAEFEGSLPLQGALTLADWKAFFDLYERSLARWLDVPHDQLSSKRSSLTFMAQPTLGCGESFPSTNPGIDGLRHAGNRRVDFVFAEKDESAKMKEERPPGLTLYGGERFGREYVPLKPDAFELRLVSRECNPIPEAEYELTLADGSTRTGTLDEKGGAIERDVPEGRVGVRYVDHEDVRAKALAGRLRYALEAPLDWHAVYMVLGQSPETLSAVVEAYKQYFDTLGGEGPRKDIEAAAKGTSEETPVTYLLAATQVEDLAPEEDPGLIAWADPDAGTSDDIGAPRRPGEDDGGTAVV